MSKYDFIRTNTSNALFLSYYTKRMAYELVHQRLHTQCKHTNQRMREDYILFL